MPNRLANETSPYLLQHANNPVDWYPWSEEALGEARKRDMPILLSVGYSACHWCHVMERESFEDEDTARVMNDLFISIKVDREERPDIDAIYMTAVQAMTGHGGWPMTVFLAPDGAPFYGGTYFPPEQRQGLPSFRHVLKSMSDTYRDRRGEVDKAAARMRELYDNARKVTQSGGSLDTILLERVYRSIAQRYDVRNGGFEGAPKFPQAMSLDFLLRYWSRNDTAYALEMAATSFRKMAHGGIYDQIGGGFHRYTVDGVWLVPHFEKMLYDNALLVRLGVHLYQATGDEEFRRIVEETIEWLSREMTSPEGGFYSSLDADSEGHEGKFYVWSEAELRDLLTGERADRVASYFGVTNGGNFEGQNILNIPNPPRAVMSRMGISAEQLSKDVSRGREILYEARSRRVWPARDDKILASWNGLMLRAVAEAARVFGREDYRTLAERNGQFLFAEMVRAGRVFRTHKDGLTRINGFLEDYAAIGLGALAMYELTFDGKWFDRASELAHSMIEWFWDDEINGFYDTARDHETLVTRPREVTDNATPSGTSLAADLLIRVAELAQNADLRRRATWIIESLAEPLQRHGPAFGHLAGVADMVVHGAVEVALVGDPGSSDFSDLAVGLASIYVPALVVAGGAPGSREMDDIALLRGRGLVADRATAYVCRHYTCDAPTGDAATLRGILAKASRVAAPAPL
ncbi:MAG: thioredoxin domain-containing protein [Anaerolineae bacterium]|nr:thioredoxin domain-containing protein [Gemmatimonadaceae bacterium]